MSSLFFPVNHLLLLKAVGGLYMVGYPISPMEQAMHAWWTFLASCVKVMALRCEALSQD